MNAGGAGPSTGSSAPDQAGERNGRRLGQLWVGLTVWAAWMAILIGCGFLIWSRLRPAPLSWPLWASLLAGTLILISLAVWREEGKELARSDDPGVMTLGTFLDFIDGVFFVLPAFLLFLFCVFAGLSWPWLGPWALEMGGCLGFLAKMICSGAGGIVGFLAGGGLMVVLVEIGSFIERLPLIALGLAKRIDWKGKSQPARNDAFDDAVKLAMLPIGLAKILLGKPERWM